MKVMKLAFPKSNAGWANPKIKKKKALVGTPGKSNNNRSRPGDQARIIIPRAAQCGNETLLIFCFVFSETYLF